MNICVNIFEELILRYPMYINHQNDGIALEITNDTQVPVYQKVCITKIMH